MFGPGFGWQELLLIAVIIALVFGVGKIADVGPALGKAISGFKRAVKEGEKEANDVASEVKQAEDSTKQ
ncbi:MAG TPA: twin-arginine translocase TatA/TatE family subunit [Anaerolineae bacterium]|nr:twin-arginine translocase TatA/TatE family subunit [Anaerolineae bacterium]